MNVVSTLKRLWRPSDLVRFNEPTLTHPVSQACTQAQTAEPAYVYWCTRLREQPKYHRKQWEFCFILQALARQGVLAPGLHGLGFGVGEEPLPAVLAAHGVSVVATDLETAKAHEKGWVATDQHAHGQEMLNARGICSPEAFDRLVSFRHTDMNAIDPDLRDFDFCWSSCALEHLGSIAQGLRFIENSLACLKPGGIAVHTTEFNCGAGEDTLDNDSTVLFRRSDFMALARSLAEQGHALAFIFDLGDRPLDRHVDVPPYAQDNHLKLALAEFVTTSFGIIVRKAGDGR